MSQSDQVSGQDPLAFVAGGGEMGALIREFDWSNNPLGPLADWPQSLKTAVSICLNSRFPIPLWWGPDLRLIYNDAWRPVLGRTKHPHALGSPGREVWPEIWHIIGPMLEGVLATGQATWSDDQLLPLDRNGYLEEAYFTYSYSPIRDENGKVGGVFSAVNETTLRVVGERRLRTLRELAAQSYTARSPDEAGRAALQTFAANPADVPFALLYLLDDDQKQARLCGCTPMPPDTPASPKVIGLTGDGGRGTDWPLADVVQSGRVRVVNDLNARFGVMPQGPLAVDPQQAVVLPLRSAAQERVVGVLILGVNPCRALDDEHRNFFDLVAGNVATAVANATAYEEERKRAEALAEIDRAKTAFFSNVSHEFRTPLTLMLGPVEDLLARSHTDLPPAAAGQLEVVNRNGLRLLRLVNNLLDFSRIEAGRVRAVYQPTDLAAFTSDLASVFRSACERAGLRLVVDCTPVGEPVFVDREMWEKVVLNLLSNAFKFTFEGEIAVSLRRAGTAAELRVRDTGTGIPTEEMPRLFERFHRVENARGRTHEGSGIGLALVQELVKLHGGSVTAQSVVGKGTSFTVTVPLGSAHLPADQIGDARTAAATGTGAGPYVEEALRWLPDVDEGRSELPAYHEPLPTPYRRAEPDAGEDQDRPRVLVADDNADMRQYVARLLAEQFRVEAVPDGEAALAAARERTPDLVLTDVMMPKLTGFGLLKELRADPRTSGLPVIMLSARAGEESRVEGLEAGADDYLVKPFSARELLARVSAHLQMARLRREANESVRRSEERFRAFMSHSPATAYIKDEEGRYVYVNRLTEETFRRPLAEWVGKTDFDLFPPDQAGQYRDNDRCVLASRTTAQFVEPVPLGDGLHHFLSFKFPIQNDDGRWLLAGMSLDITEKKRAEEELQRERDRLRITLASIGDAVITTDTEGRIANLNAVAESLTGWANAEATGQPLDAVFRIVNEQTRQPVENPATRALREGVVVGLANHTVLIGRDGTERPIDDSAAPIRGEAGHVLGCVLVFRDVTERRRLEKQASQRAEAARKLAAIVDSSEDAIISKTLDSIIQSWNAAAERIFGYTAEEAVGRPITMLFPADRLEEEDRIIARIRSGERVEHFDTVRVRKDGTAIPVSLTISPIRDEEGRIVGASKIARDITQRTQAEAALRHSEGRLAAELEATTRLHDLSSRLLSATDLTTALHDVLENAVVTCGADFGNIQLFNPHYKSLEIAVQRGFQQDFLDYFRFVRVDEGSCCAQAMQSGERIVIEDVALDPGFEPHRPVAAAAGFRAVASTPLKAHDGAVVGMLSVHFRSARRVSERDGRLLDLYARHAADLIERLRLLDELRHVAAELSEANRRKDEFLATLAHELRNPLAPLRNGLQVMKLARNDAGAVEQSRAMMERQLAQMVRLIDDLMDLSRVSRGKITLKKERVELAGVVRHAVETSRPLIEQAGHQLAVDVPPDPIYVDADVIRLAQVFANLLNNAAKYTEPGGRITLSVERQGGEVAVSVRDTGIGIPAHMLPRLFEMFTQVDRSLERSQGGLGIGLALVKGLVEMHGGTVEAKSEGHGMGSEFVVRLPVVLSLAGREPGGDADRGTGTTARRRILVADDNRDAALSLAMMLRLMGNETQTAHDGLEAVDVAAAFRPDVILLDIGMPRLNGYEACRRIREQPWGKDAVLVAVTGWGQEEDRRRSKEAGFDLHMVKPVEPAALEKLLAEMRATTG